MIRIGFSGGSWGGKSQISNHKFQTNGPTDKGKRAKREQAREVGRDTKDGLKRRGRQIKCGVNGTGTDGNAWGG